MKRIVLIVLLLFFVAGPATAQEAGVRRHTGPLGAAPTPPPAPPAPLGKWWKNSDVVKELQLSDAQIKQIEQTFIDYRLKLIDLRAEVERQELRLQPLIEADRPDEQQVGAQVDAVLAARAKLEKTNTMMMLAIRRALSVEQWKKLQAIQQKREGPFMRHFEGPVPQPGAHMERDVFYYRRGPGGAPEATPPPPGAEHDE
ncbi:MAG TPA: periplasmic heavy metal sensor [Terriglobales bacterium]|nr:periplasmic heavy metal sensor [Terriglobales bacterium]